MRNKKKFIFIGAVAIGGLVLAGCQPTNVNSADRATAAKQLQGYDKNQPVPIFDWSQYRQNLIEIETAQARTTQTTTFFFNQGVQDPIAVCPSIGFPIASTSELTNPEAKVVNHDLTLPQIESNGVFPGASSGTYVICIDAQGKAYAHYWEGFVSAVTGPAKWNTDTHQVELVGPPSFTFSKGR